MSNFASTVKMDNLVLTWVCVLSEFVKFLFKYSKMEFKLGSYFLLRIDMIAFNMISSIVSSAITSSIELYKCRLILNWSLYKNIYVNDFIQVLVIGEIEVTISFVGIN